MGRCHAVTTPDPTQFFLIVAAAVPTLLFGGIITDVLKPPRRPSTWSAGVVTCAVVFLPLLVELTAIPGALGLDPGPFGTYLCAVFLVGACLGIGWAIARRWFDPRPPTALTWTILVLLPAATFGIGFVVTGSTALLHLEQSIPKDQTAAQKAEIAADARKLQDLRNLAYRQFDAYEQLDRALYLAGGISRRELGRRLIKLEVSRQTVLTQQAGELRKTGP
jgi:hypothetical protein